MRTPVLLALAIPVVLSSCAALGNLISTDPVVDSAGPLVVGKTYSVNGVINGGTVSVSVPVPQLVDVTFGRGTVSNRDSIAALQEGRNGFVSASFLNSPSDSLNFVWISRSASGVPAQYTCTVTNTLQVPYTGVLTLQQSGNTYRGTCSATSN